jgi:integration host factor subunit alpha
MTLGRIEFTEAVHDMVDLSRKECRNLIDQTIAEITIALVLGETLRISRFGSFTVRRRRQRVRRNPNTGEPVNAPAHRAIWFQPSGKLKAKIAKG